MNPDPATQTLRFVRRGEIVSVPNVPPSQTLLELLRERLCHTGTKEGCGEGDCGACTVVVGEPDGQRLRYRAINSCIRLAHSVDGLALWTVEDLQDHPAQQAMVACHGSQCGFCTPGFVMSLFGMYQQRLRRGQPITREVAAADLSGNLCRCTGYRPILDAAQRMGDYAAPPDDERATLALLRRLRAAGVDGGQGAYAAPEDLAALLKVRAQRPTAQLVAGCTDVGLWVTKGHQQYAEVIDVTRCREIAAIERYRHHIAIGAAARLSDAYAALVAERPELQAFAERFAGLPVRQSGTMGGNVANGSPIGDSMPLLIALGASLVLMRWSARRGIEHREIAIEDFYTGYRQTLLRPDEIVAWIKVPRPAGECLRVYKVSKRRDDDISAVCLALAVWTKGGVVQRVSIGVGGVAATPVRARRTEALLQGAAWTAETCARAADALSAEFSPISDMRASAAYRRTVLGNLMRRYWLEQQGQAAVTLEGWTP